jgi:YD repeat-containing protein
MRAYLLSGFLALVLLAPSGAQAINVGAAKWAANGTGTIASFGFGSCEEALEIGLEQARAFWNDPLVFVGSNCDQARPTGLWPDFPADYRRTWDFPTTPNRSVGLTAYCDTGSLAIGPAPAREVTCVAPDPAPGKNAGRCLICEQMVGNPINAGFGNKYQVETDYVGPGPFPLRLERTHNSMRGLRLTNRSRLAANWTHTYARSLAPSGSPGGVIVAASALRPDGRTIDFNLSGGNYLPDFDLFDYRLLRLTNGWQLTTPEDEVETYDSDGKLVSIANRAGLTQTLSYYTSGTNKSLLQTVTDPFGRTLGFGYQDDRLTTVTIPGGGTFTYSYVLTPLGDQQLLSATDPMGRVRGYTYNGGNPGGFSRMLSGITDELGVAYASWDYQYDVNQPFAGYATSSQHFGGADKVTISYTGGITTITTFVSAAVSSTRTYGFENKLSVLLNSSITGPDCPQCGPKRSINNGVGHIKLALDWNDVCTDFLYDPTEVGFETRRREGMTFDTVNLGCIGTPVRVRSRTLHPVFRLPATVAEPLRITTNTYDTDGTQCGARGALCTRSVQATTDTNGALGLAATPTGAPRVWTYTYNANGQVLTMNGPRTDVTDTTTYTYDAQGNVATVTNALNQTTQITSYNVHGQPLTLIDANGLTTTLAYDGRQRLTSRNVGGETTTYDYDFAGQLTKVTLPDGSFLSYSYDGAHRLTGIQDNLANRIAYTLDLAGNRTKEEVFDPANALAQTKSRVYSSLNRLFQELGALSQTTEYGYDSQGNVFTVKDPLNHTSTNLYDRLNRLSQVTDPASGVTQYGYNGLSALTSVKDPRNLTTSYTVDGLGNLNTQVSPDTGTTANTYDAAGNLATQTDAKGQVTTYAYDATNRVSLITFHDGSKQAYAYDQGTNGIGRLSSITETNPANVTTSVIAYAYEQHGRVTSETRTVNGISYVLAYQFDSSGRLTGLTYPSGRTVTYTLDALGRISQVTTTKDGLTQVVAQNIQYFPFGGVSGYTAGNGRVVVRGRDQDGRIASYSLGLTQYTVGYDAASRITGIVEAGNPVNANTYGYDTLDRLTSAVLPNSSFGYGYDSVGNRLTKTVGANTDTYTYGSTSNRIATLTPFGSPLKTFTLDANGSTTNDAANTFAYDTRGRMVQSTNSASTVTSYQVNALGQRIRKTNTGDDRVFTYDTWGKLIAESDPGGTIKRELIYLGDLVIGRVQQ